MLLLAGSSNMSGSLYCWYLALENKTTKSFPKLFLTHLHTHTEHISIKQHQQERERFVCLIETMVWWWWWWC